jgi:HlyD family secretion protein
VAEAAATLAEARANNERSKQLRDRGFYSPQQGIQSQTAAETALARLQRRRARLRSAELRRAKAEVLAPDDGIITARTATVGSLTQPGQELFRLIRGGRLEWRAEVTAGELVHFRSLACRPDWRPPAVPVSRAACAPSRQASIRRRATAWSMSICRRLPPMS